MMALCPYAGHNRRDVDQTTIRPDVGQKKNQGGVIPADGTNQTKTVVWVE